MPTVRPAVAVVDIDGDGRSELVVNEFGERPDDAGPTEFPPGGLSIYWREGDGPVGEDATTWRREAVLDADDGLYFPNELTAEDLDLDGDVDLIVPVGFLVCEFAPRFGPCGALIWLEQTDDGWQQHDIVPNGDARFSTAGSRWTSTVTAPSTSSPWPRNRRTPRSSRIAGPLRAACEADATVIGAGGGSLPVVHDVDGDGDLDVGSAECSTPGRPTSGSRTPPTARPERGRSPATS